MGMSAAMSPAMAQQVITCPQSAEPETIEFELTPFGMVISWCSRLATDSTLVCPRTCAQTNRRCSGQATPCVIEFQSLLHRRS